MRKQLYISLLAAILALPLLTRAEEVVVDTVEISLSRDIENVDSLSDASSDDDMSSAVDVSISRDLETSDVSSDDDILSAVDVSRYRDIETLDVVSDSVPTWYIPAEIPDSLKAPFGAPRSSVRGFGEEEAERSASISRADSRSGVSADDRAPLRAAAAACLTDSVLTFNIDSVLTEATTYDYDAAGRTIRTTVWQYNADGSRTGKSKQEYAFDANGTQIYTGTFAWDAATNDWKGTAKSEYVYNEAHKMESNITYTWVNNTWLPSQALTYAYDAAGRETEFTTYARNASLNRLVPSKQRLQTWYNASKKTQEINYTAYANGAWSAGTRKDYQYDAKGNQIEYTYYASYSGGNWVGSTHELWTYNAANKNTYYEKQTWSNGTWANSSKEVWEFNSANKQTLHEKYSGSGTNWTITLREISGYDAAGNNTLVENYQLKSNVWTGSKKEEYTYNDKKKKINTYKYKWSNNDWVYNTWAVSDYDAAGNAIETANYSWTNNAWKGTGTRTLKTYNSSKKVTEQITQTWPSGATDWVNATRQTTTYSGAKTTQEATYTWQNEAWVGTSRSDWHYNAAGQNDTIKTYTNNGTDWIYSNRTVNTYDSRGNNILTHNAQWNGTRWVMTSMNRLDVLFDSANRQTLNATYTCGADSIWRGLQKDTTAYTSSGLSLYSARYESWVNNTWVPSYRIEYVYDDAGRALMNQRYDWENNRWQGNYRYEYNYDENGRQVMAAVYNSWSATTLNWVGSSKTETEYSSSGKVLSTINYSWRNNAWSASNRFLYGYDANNREIEQVVQNYSDNQWLNSLRFEKDYRGSTQIKSNEYTWSNGTWMMTRRSEKDYDNDSQAKLRRDVTGTWNNSGIVQSFTDKHYFYSCDAPADNNGAQPRTPTELEEIDENNGNYENDDTNVQPFDPMLPTYNLQGQSVDPATYHGIVIQNGKKYVL